LVGCSIRWVGIPVVYYVWVNVLGIIVVAQVWTVATSVLTMPQARRLFPLLCGGGVLGSMLGGLIVAAGVNHTGTDNLILVSVILLGLAVPTVWKLASHYAPRRQDPLVQNTDDDSNSGMSDVLKMTVRTRYLRLIASLLRSRRSLH
jgi:ATP/ADP translocase